MNLSESDFYSWHLKKIMTPFLQNHDLNFFQFCRIYKNDTAICLITHPEMVHERIRKKRGMLAYVDSAFLKAFSYIFLWNERFEKKETDLARQFNIDNGICFIERHYDFYDMAAFGSENSKRNMQGNYLNIISKLKAMTKIFQINNASLLQEAHKNRFFIPCGLNDPNSQKLFIGRNFTKFITANGIKFSLTLMEQKVLFAMSEAFTNKEIASLYNISVRTVETYIDRVRNKSGLSTKTELLNMLYYI